MGAIEATLEAIATACGGACQVVAICGRNKKLARRLQSRHAFAISFLTDGSAASATGLLSFAEDMACVILRAAFQAAFCLLTCVQRVKPCPGRAPM